MTIAESLHWCYRVLDDGGRHRLIQTYHDSHGKIHGWSEGHEPEGDSLTDIFVELQMMSRAVDVVQQGLAAVLTLDDLPADVKS